MMVSSEIQAERKVVEEAAAEAKAVADAALKARLEQMEQQAMLATPIKARAYVPVQRKSDNRNRILFFRAPPLAKNIMDNLFGHQRRIRMGGNVIIGIDSWMFVSVMCSFTALTVISKQSV